MKRVLFLVLSAVLAVLFIFSFIEDSTREWTAYQRRFIGTLERSERRGVSAGIRQVIVSDLKNVDRCMTCHLAIDRPQLALAEEPFKSHPALPGEVDKDGNPTPFIFHPIEKFGCTVCHGGQGLATEVRAAHGDVSHWEEPLLRGPLVQASCRQCHGNTDLIREQVPLLVEGRELFKAKGCYGCHAIKDFGQTVSVDLAEVGSKSYLLMEADFEMMPPPHDRIHWLKRKLAHPRVLNPGVRPEALPPGEEEVFTSAMPQFGFSDHEIEALTVYLLSLQASDLPASYVTPEIPQPKPTYASDIERGQAVFEQFGCTACHGAAGVGGRRNWNAGLGEEVPPLLYVKAYYEQDVESLKQVIRNGRQPTPRASPHRPRPPLYMPAWKDRIPEEDINALVAYLFSLSDQLPASPLPAAQPAETASN